MSAGELGRVFWVEYDHFSGGRERGRALATGRRSRGSRGRTVHVGRAASVSGCNVAALTGYGRGNSLRRRYSDNRHCVYVHHGDSLTPAAVWVRKPLLVRPPID